MKSVLVFILVHVNILWASQEEMVGTSVRLIIANEENREEDYWDDRMVGPTQKGPFVILGNYDSIHSINPKVKGLIAVCFLSFVLYIIFRVRRSLKKDKRNRPN